MTMSERVNVAVLGAGLIGIDLIEKIQRSEALDCRLVVGRDERSLGLHRAAEMGYATAVGGIRSLMESQLPLDIVFDASNADCHAEHWSKLESTSTTLIDLTPAQLGTMIVPTVNGAEALAGRHLSLVSCGGQTAIPVLHAIAPLCRIDYAEVVCTAASASAGRATRRNLDQYIETTQAAICAFTGAAEVKVLVNLSPAKPPPPFRVVITAVAPTAEPDPIRSAVEAAARDVRAFAPGFAVTSCAVADGHVGVVVEVTAQGARIPRYAGNLDIINAGAVLLAEQYATADVQAGCPARRRHHARRGTERTSDAGPTPKSAIPRDRPTPGGSTHGNA
jgi:acetaldehyde dehydrogenase